MPFLASKHQRESITEGCICHHAVSLGSYMHPCRMTNYTADTPMNIDKNSIVASSEMSTLRNML